MFVVISEQLKRNCVDDIRVTLHSTTLEDTSNTTTDIRQHIFTLVGTHTSNQFTIGTKNESNINENANTENDTENDYDYPHDASIWARIQEIRNKRLLQLKEQIGLEGVTYAEQQQQKRQTAQQRHKQARQAKIDALRQINDNNQVHHVVKVIDINVNKSNIEQPSKRVRRKKNNSSTTTSTPSVTEQDFITAMSAIKRMGDNRTQMAAYEGLLNDYLHTLDHNQMNTTQTTPSSSTSASSTSVTTNTPTAAIAAQPTTPNAQTATRLTDDADYVYDVYHIAVDGQDNNTQTTNEPIQPTTAVTSPTHAITRSKSSASSTSRGIRVEFDDMSRMMNWVSDFIDDDLVDESAYVDSDIENDDDDDENAEDYYTNDYPDEPDTSNDEHDDEEHVDELYDVPERMQQYIETGQNKYNHYAHTRHNYEATYNPEADAAYDAEVAEMRQRFKDASRYMRGHNATYDDDDDQDAQQFMQQMEEQEHYDMHAD